MEFYTSVRRTKYKWTLMWCTILYHVLAINVATASILLEKQHYVRYGEALNITCSTNNPLSRAENLTFSVNNITKPSVIVNGRSIQLYEEKPRRQNTKYYCTDAVDNEKGVVEVMVDAPPRAERFRCESRDRQDLRCTWAAAAAPSRLRTRASLTFLGPYGDDLKPCKITTENGIQSCLWNKTTRPAYRTDFKTYTFKLTSTNEFDSNMQQFTVDHCAVVRPAPPLRLVATSVRPRGATLQWNISKNLLNFCEVYHSIELQYRVGESIMKESLNISMLSMQDNSPYEFSYDLSLPYAHVIYEVRVAIQTSKNRQANETELWSDFSAIKFWSASERPHRPPDVPAGAFYVPAAYHTHRHLHVYWGQLQEYEMCGDKFVYRVLQAAPVVPTNSSAAAHPPAWAGEMSVTRVPLDLPYAPNTPLDILVESANSVGSSSNSSRLYITAQSSLLEGPYSFTKNSNPNGTHELLWDFDQPAVNFDNYTLLWCIDNQTHVCLDQVHFATLSSSVSSHVMELPSDRRYQFALAANSGARSSGMLWTTCDLSKHDLRIISNVTVVNFGRTQYAVVFTWKLQCLLKDIIKYNITFCAVNEKTDSCRVNSILNISTSSPQDRLVKMDLSYNIKYRFYVAVLTESGPIETIRDNVKDVLYPSYNHDSAVTAIIIFIISFVLLCWLIVNCYKRHQVTNDIKVILPADLQLNQHYIIRNDKPSWLPYIRALDPFDWSIFKEHATDIRASHSYPDIPTPTEVKSDTKKSSHDSVTSRNVDEVDRHDDDSVYLIEASQMPTVECPDEECASTLSPTPYEKCFPDDRRDSNPAYVVARPCVPSNVGYLPHLAMNQLKTNTSVGKPCCDGIQVGSVAYDIFRDGMKGVGDESECDTPLLQDKTEVAARDAYVTASPAQTPNNGYVQFKTELKF